MIKYYFLIFLLVGSLSSFAQKRYIDGIQSVTFRTGPGTDNKIIRMLETDSTVTLLEAGETWSKVKDSEGDEGYVLNRFVTKDIPYILRYKWLKSNQEKLEEKNRDLDEKIKELQTELKTTQGELASTAEKLKATENSFEELKTGSADYIGLKDSFDQTLIKLNQQTKKVEKLEATVNTYYIQWFLAGGSVLFLGWLIGLISRKKKYQSGIRL